MVSIRQIFASLALASLATALPSQVAKRFTDPTTNGFPNPNTTQLLTIEAQADGDLPNSPPPPTLNKTSVTAFQLIAFNELFEVAYFSSLRDNVSSCDPNYQHKNKDKLIKILDTIIAVCAPQ
jgi:hypothetical protein